jgi:hypothetical protein
VISAGCLRDLASWQDDGARGRAWRLFSCRAHTGIGSTSAGLWPDSRGCRQGRWACMAWSWRRSRRSAGWPGPRLEAAVGGRLVTCRRPSPAGSRPRAGGSFRRVSGRRGTGRRRRGSCRGLTGRRDGFAGGTGRRSSTVTRIRGCGGTGPGMWSRPLRRRRAVVTWREYASRAGLERHRGPELRRCRRDLTRRLAPHLQPLICEPALVVRLPGAGLVAPSPARPSLVVLVRMPCLGPRSEQAPDLAGSEADQLLGSAVMRHRCPGKLSTGAGAPFERR